MNGRTGAETESVLLLILEQETGCGVPPTEVLGQEDEVDHHRTEHSHPHSQTGRQARVRLVIQHWIDNRRVSKRIIHPREADVGDPKDLNVDELEEEDGDSGHPQIQYGHDGIDKVEVYREWSGSTRGVVERSPEQ